MRTLLLHDDAIRSPEMRHEIGEPVMDPLVFIDHDGRRIVVGSSLEASIFEAREDVVDEFWNMFDLGIEELVKDPSFPQTLFGAETALRAVRRLGVSEVVVPPTFRVLTADHLREHGVTVTVDPEAWIARRRHKSPWELEGIERAQRAAENAMLAAARMLREAEPTATGQLRFEGEILTAEWVRQAMVAELLAQGAESEDIIIHSGDACLKGHEMGTGPILPDQSCIIDCFPRDRKTGVYSDMTRTFVPGTPSEKLKDLHTRCREALDIAYENIKPGSDSAHRKVSDYFHENGFPTREHHDGDGPLEEGFWHSLGHGVGLQVHERPSLGRRSDELQEGDVVAVEPGLYFGGVGGVRLEDTVLVTEGGVEFLTDPFTYDLEP
ncbi:MAG: Xaa-Pro aminopeptidase [Actinomycetota bacterium]|jgi:Xaa-Pro aminopeptidase|nr:Xaa-Pro aminopeptidase [Actinomycetota bacterium]